MDNFKEIFFSILGIGLYWFLSNLGKKKTEDTHNHNIDDDNIVPPSYEVNNNKSEEHLGDYNSNEPNSFKDLLNVLSDPSKIIDRQKELNPLDPSSSEKRLLSDLDEYSPSRVAQNTYESGMDRYYSEKEEYQWKDDYAIDIDREKVDKGKNITKKKKNKKKQKSITQLLKSPNRVRDAYIMNEILTRKYD